jgi:type II secretory pathway pseudopilin PulG
MTPISADLHRSTPRPSGRARPTAVAAAVATALGVLLAPAAMSQTASQADVQALKQQLQQLQQKIDKLEQQQAQPVPPPPAIAEPAHNVAEAAKAGPSFYAGPMKVTLGGFVELMVVNRNRNEAADWASNFNTSIPYPNSHNHDLSEFHLTERQSRLQALVESPEINGIKAESYVESDFGGAGGTSNYNESNSFAPRVRHFYADLNDKNSGFFFLFGQTWSLITAEKVGLGVRTENIPQTIDGQYVPGFSWLRVPQIRFVEKFNDMFSAGLTLENPAEQVAFSSFGTNPPVLQSVYNTPGASNSFTASNGATSTNISTDYLPDVVVKVAFDPGWGHYEAFALNRWFRARNLTTQDNVKSTGQGYGANILLPLVPKVLDFQAGVLAGKGVGHYGSAQLPDVTVNPNTLGLTPMRGLQALVGVVFRPTPMVTTYVYAGKEMVDSQHWDYPGGGKPYGYGYGDPLANNSGCGTEPATTAATGTIVAGGECAANTSQIQSGAIGGWWKFYQGPLGNMQVGLSDTYIKRESFGGTGGAPNTNINIILVAFRYYPFQR